MRASQLPTFRVCASSALPAKQPYNPQNEAASLGTAVHALCEAMVKGADIDTNAAAKLHDVDLEEMSALYLTAAHMWPDIALYFETPWVEVRFEGEDMTGTADLVSVSEGEINLLDWKTGRIRKDYRHQLMAYLWLARRKFGKAQTYRAGVAWLAYNDLDFFEANNADLDIWYQQHEAQRELIGKQYAPGEACTYCPRQFECEARESWLRSTSMSLAENAHKELTPELMGDLWPKSRALKKAIEQYEKAVRAHIEQTGGLELPSGKQLVLRQYTTEKIDPVVAWKVLTTEHGFSPEDMAKVLKATSTTIKKIVGDRSQRGEKQANQARAINDIRNRGGVDAIPYTKLTQIKGDKQ